jgi:hypothetical protein
MNDNLNSQLPDTDMQGAPRALLRAAQRAREVARQTGTQLVIVRNGVLMEVDPDTVDSGATSLTEVEELRQRD